MGRKKSGKPAGRSSSFQGTKSVFLESFKDEFLKAQKTDPSAFYTRITHIFLKKYGFDLPFDQDVAGGIIPEDDEGNIVSAPGLPDVEVERRRQILKDLRPVSLLLFRVKIRLLISYPPETRTMVSSQVHC